MIAFLRRLPQAAATKRIHPLFLIPIFFVGLNSARGNPPSTFHIICPEPPGVQLSQVFPERPSAPPQLRREKKKIDEFGGCNRQFVYQGVRRPIDSYYRTDAENLRPIIQDVPDAVAELNAYQATRRDIATSAYVGTVGVAMMIFGILSRSIIGGHQGDIWRRIGLFGGAAVTGGSIIYTVGILSGNESHIDDAVSKYNAKNPAAKIELQFSTGGIF